MTTRYSTQMNNLRNTVPKVLPLNAEFGGTVHHQIADITLAGQANGDTIELFHLPKGARVRGFSVLTDTSLGSSTIAIGITGTVAKYKAAAVFTALNTPTGYMVLAGGLAVLTADEIVLLTIAAADFPSSGNLRIAVEYGLDS